MNRFTTRQPSACLAAIATGTLALAVLLAGCSPAGYGPADRPEPAAEIALEMAPLPEPSIADDFAPTPRTLYPSPGSTQRRPSRGVLTAGDIDDTLNLAAFQRYQSRGARELGLPRSDLSNPVLAQLTDPSGNPAPGVLYTLRRPGAAEAFHTGYSGVDGMITVFPATLGAGRLASVELRSFAGDNGEEAAVRLPADGGRRRITVNGADGWKPDFLDLAFVVDTTGSMADELAWLTRELRGIVAAARRSAPGADIRYALIVYRDRGDDYVVRNYGFTDSQSRMLGWLRAQDASGGGDYPEAAAAALGAGAALNWRRGRGERLMFHIADAPPHDSDARAYLAAARVAAAKNVQIFGLGASGVAAESEFLMRQAAAQTSGRYLFLTDDSGIGYAHAEPTIACYRVTLLTDLLVRVLRSELSGHRVEATGGQVIREVGSYNAGACRN